MENRVLTIFLNLPQLELSHLRALPEMLTGSHWRMAQLEQLIKKTQIDGLSEQAGPPGLDLAIVMLQLMKSIRQTTKLGLKASLTRNSSEVSSILSVM